jgi:hypothetical protein
MRTKEESERSRSYQPFLPPRALCFSTKNPPVALRDVMADGVRKAEILLAQMDRRWSVNRVPGKN